MNRRQALSTSAAVLGGSFLASSGLLSGCGVPEKKVWSWSADDMNFLDELGEIILPTSPTSPGAKDAHVSEYMKIMVTECFDESRQTRFLDGVAALQDRCTQMFKKDFIELSAEERQNLLTKVDQEAAEYNANRKSGDPRHNFSIVKNLVMEGYFTSEVGVTKALRYVPIPARYDGCIEYTPGTPAWA